MIVQQYATVNGVRIYYERAGVGEPLLVIHGFPQTSRSWRHTMPELSKHFTVIAPDYRGAGESDRPSGGYDKQTMMEDLRGLMHQLGFSKIYVAGHDMGAMIAFRYAAVHSDEVRKLILLDAPIPGTKAREKNRGSQKIWHVNFHKTPDLPEVLVSGRERAYLTHFFKTRFTRPWAISKEDMEAYIEAYSAPGAMHAAFEAYRATDKDALDNKPYLDTKLPMPILVIAGDTSASSSILESMCSELGNNVDFRIIKNSGHWLNEQEPEAIGSYFVEFLKK